MPFPARVVFMGTPAFAVASLDALLAAGIRPVAVYTQADKPAGRGRQLTPPPVKVRALEEGLEVLQPASLKTPEAQAELKALDPDLIAVAAYGKILPQAVLDVPRLGCVNVHASLLPRHRGASPIARAIWEGDPEVGVSIMRMEAGLDTGPVYLARGFATPPGATTGTLTPRLAQLGAQLLLEALPAIEAGTLNAVPQRDEEATLAPRILPEQGRLDFSRPAASLERQIRAFDPWPGCTIEVGEERIKVLSAEVGSDVSAPPGEILTGPGLAVACGGGSSLILTTIQRAGKRPLPASEVLRGFKIPQGTRL
jgi:methionyl-tRNA formyltransferase